MVEADFSHVELVREHLNIGYTRAVNIGLERCRAPYALLCNPDCELEADTVARLAAFLDATPSAAGVAPRLYEEDGEMQDFCYRFPNMVIAVVRFTEVGRRIDARTGLHIEHWWARQDLRGATSPVAVDHIGAACLLLRRQAVTEPLDEGMPIMFSDVELSWRLAERGWLVYLEPAAAARHIQGASFETVPWRVVRHEMQRGLRRFYGAHRGRLRSGLVAAALEADAVARAAVRLVIHRSLAPARQELRDQALLRRNLPSPGSPWVE